MEETLGNLNQSTIRSPNESCQQSYYKKVQYPIAIPLLIERLMKYHLKKTCQKHNRQRLMSIQKAGNTWVSRLTTLVKIA